MGKDLVIVFDIESGVWGGSKEGIEIPEEHPLETIGYKLIDLQFDRVFKRENKITIPRYVSIGILPWETFSRGCYQDPELAFRYKMDIYHFTLSEGGIPKFLGFWKDVLDYAVEEGNIVLLAHNANYDVNGILNACRSEDGNRIIDLTRDYIETQKGTYTAFPENKHEDKTFDIKLQHHIRLIDTVNLSPVGCRSLAQYGRRASAMYHKAYYKGDTYNYDYVIRTGFDIPPTYREIRYTKRDLQLCLYAAMINIYTYRKQLWGRGCYYYATDFPFSATQRDRDVNDGLFLLTHHPDWNRSQIQTEYRTRKKKFKSWCERWGNPPDVQTYELFHRSGTGGIISVNESYVNRPVENVGSMDLSSSYPAAAGDFWYPRIEQGGYFTGPLKDKVFRSFLESTIIPLADRLRSGTMVIDDFSINHLFRVGMSVGFVCKLRLHNVVYRDFGTDSNGYRYWMPITPWKAWDDNTDRQFTMRDKIIAMDEMVYYFNHVGLIIFLAFYEVGSIELVDGYSFEMKKIHPIIHDRFEAGLIGKQTAKQIRKDWEKGNITDKEMIDRTGLQHLTGQDKDSIRDELKAYYSSSKVPLNAMYGCNYRKILRDKRIIVNDEYDLDSGDYDPATTSAYPTGEYIAIYGQLKIAHAMLWAMHKRLPILYVHTDSLKIQDLTPELVAEYNQLIRTPPGEGSFRDYGVGLMDYEGSHDLSVVIGNMRIVSWDRDKGFDITMSGLNEGKAFPRNNIGKMDFFDFVAKFLNDGHRYACNEETSSGKTSTDYRTAGLYVPGIGYSMQSILDSEFVLNQPESPKQRNIVSMYERYIGKYHDAAWYAKRRLAIRSDKNAK